MAPTMRHGQQCPYLFYRVGIVVIPRCCKLIVLALCRVVGGVEGPIEESPGLVAGGIPKRAPRQ